MFQLIISKRFQKKLKVFLMKHPDIESVFLERLDILQKDPWDDRLKTHSTAFIDKNISFVLLFK